MVWTKTHQKVLDLIVKDEYAREYFFQTASSPLFLLPLFKRGFFSSESIPEYPVSWFQYKYLTEVAKEIQEHIVEDKRYDKYVAELLSILKYFSQGTEALSPEKVLLVFECFCDIFKLLPTDNIPLVSIKELVSLCPYLNHLNLVTYRIKELIQKFLKNKGYKKAQELFQDFLPILLQSELKESDKKYFLQEISKIPFFIRGNGSLFRFLLNIISERREPRDIIDYQFGSILISLIHRKNVILGKVTSKKGTFTFEIPIIPYKNRNNLVSLVCKKIIKIPKNERNKIADEIKSLYYTHLWKRHYGIHSLISLEKGEQYVCTVDEQLMLLVSVMLNQQANIQPLYQFKTQFLNPLYGIGLEIGWRILLFFFGKISPRYNSSAITFLKRHKELLFVDSMFEGEVFDLLLLLASSCKGEKQKKALVDLVKKGPYLEFVGSVSKKANYEQFWKKKWLAALLAIPECKKAYQELSNIPKEWINSRDAQSREIIYQSPFAQEYILDEADTNTDRLINKIQEFDMQYQPDTRDFFYEKPSPEGLAEALEKAAQKYPQIMAKILGQFDQINFTYIEAILNGIRRSGNKIDSNSWKMIFADIAKILKKIFSTSFVGSPQQKERLITIILGIISEKYNEFKGQGAYLQIMDIVEFIYHQYKAPVSSLEKNSYDSYLTASLNSVWGLLAQAIIGLSLSVSPFRNASHKNIWEKKAQQLYSELLSSNIPEAYVFLGFHYDCFFFLNRRWLNTKIKSIAQKTAERIYFFSGYLYLKVFFPDELHNFKNDYHSLVQKEVFSPSTQEIAAERLVTLLINQEKVEDAKNEMEWIVKHAYPLFLSYIAHSLHNLLTFGKYRITKGENAVKKTEIVFHFWNQVYRKFKDNELNTDERRAMVSLLSLLPLIPRMNHQYRNMLSVSLKYCENQPPISFLDNLLKITKITPKDCKRFCGEVLNDYIKTFPVNIAGHTEILLQLVDMIYEKDNHSQPFQNLLQILQQIHAHELASKIARRFELKFK